MPRWLGWFIGGLVMVAVGVVLGLIGVQALAPGVAFGGQLLMAGGFWVLIVAAVILGVGIGNEADHTRLQAIDRKVTRLEGRFEKDG